MGELCHTLLPLLPDHHHVLKIVISKIIKGILNSYRLPKNYTKTYCLPMTSEYENTPFHNITPLQTAEASEGAEFSLHIEPVTVIKMGMTTSLDPNHTSLA